MRNENQILAQIRWIVTNGGITIISGLLLLNSTAFAKSFNDIASNHPQSIAIDSLSEAGVIQGYEDGSFKPDQPIVRAEALKIILATFGIETLENNSSKFTDVNQNEWFYPYVQTGISKNIIQVYTDQTFRPGQTVNIVEALKMGLVAANRSVLKANDSRHPDVPANAWFKKYFDYAIEQNLLELGQFGDFNAQENMTRAKFTELIYRIKESGAGKKFDISYNWLEANKSGLIAKYPLDWIKTELTGTLVFRHADPGYTNTFIAHTTPSSAHIVIEILQGADSQEASALFDSLEREYMDLYGIQEMISDRKTESGRKSLTIHVANKGILDHYLFLEDGKVIAAQAEYGLGPKRIDFVKQIYYFHKHLDFNPNGLTTKSTPPKTTVDVSKADTLEFIKNKILVNGAGQDILNAITDEFIFETDLIGVGTGPVDYYYSNNLDTTIKYERSSNTVLDTQTGKTSAF